MHSADESYCEHSYYPTTSKSSDNTISSLASTKVKNIAPNTLSAHNLKDVQSKIKSTETLQNQKQNREKQGRHDPSSAPVKSEPDVIGVNDECQIVTEAAATTDSKETKSNISTDLKVVNEESVTASKKVSFSSKTLLLVSCMKTWQIAPVRLNKLLLLALQDRLSPSSSLW